MGTTSKIQASVLASKVDKSERSGNWWESNKNEGTRLGRSESEEYIVGREAGVGRGGAVPLEIWESRDVTVDRGSVMDGNTSVTTVTSPGMVAMGSGRGRRAEMNLKGSGNGNIDMGMRTGMYDGSGKDFETRTTVTAIGNGGSGRKSESDSSRSLRLSR